MQLSASSHNRMSFRFVVLAINVVAPARFETLLQFAPPRARWRKFEHARATNVTEQSSTGSIRNGAPRMQPKTRVSSADVHRLAIAKNGRFDRAGRQAAGHDSVLQLS